MDNKKEYNAGDEKQVKDLEKKAKNERDQELEDLREILNLKAGVRFFKRFLEDGQIFCSTFTGNSHTYFNEGKRAFALKYFSDICEASPKQIAELMIKKEDE